MNYNNNNNYNNYNNNNYYNNMLNKYRDTDPEFCRDIEEFKKLGLSDKQLNINKYVNNNIYQPTFNTGYIQVTPPQNNTNQQIGYHPLH